MESRPLMFMANVVPMKRIQFPAHARGPSDVQHKSSIYKLVKRTAARSFASQAGCISVGIKLPGACSAFRQYTPFSKTVRCFSVDKGSSRLIQREPVLKRRTGKKPSDLASPPVLASAASDNVPAVEQTATSAKIEPTEIPANAVPKAKPAKQRAPAPPPPPPRGSKLLIVGLGNPGQEYEMTRHNIGFHVVEELANRLRASPFKPLPKFKATVAETTIGDKTVYLMKPLTYMNLSGSAIQPFMNFYKIPSHAIMVVVDDTNIDFGALRVREKGSAGGHNGLKSIQQNIGQDYPRLRVGVGAARGDLAQYVLNRFNKAEQKELQDVYWNCNELLEEWIRSEAFANVMNKLSKIGNSK